MTVRELIDALSSCPHDSHVVMWVDDTPYEEVLVVERRTMHHDVRDNRRPLTWFTFPFTGSTSEEVVEIR